MTPTFKVHAGGTRREVEIVGIVDTGFDGDLCLPTDLAVTLGLELVAATNVELADGSMKKELVFLGTAKLLGARSTAMIFLTDSEDALIGTTLLAGCVLNIDFDQNKVVIRRKKRRVTKATR